MDALPLLVEMPAERYHADPCERPSLSHSVATMLLNQSPLHAWLRHPKFCGLAGEATDDMERGSILHALVFSGGAGIAVIEAENFRTKAAQEARDDARAAGKIPVVAAKYRDLQLVARDLARAIGRAGYDLAEFRCEVAAFWEEETPLGPVVCRGMMDAVLIERGTILDLKCVSSAHPDAFAKKVIEFGYDVQFAAYTSAMQKLNPEIAGREDFVWLLAEELPFGAPERVTLTLARPDGSLREYGRSRWARACGLWAQCLLTNDWPSYAPLPVTIEAPAWAMKEEVGT